MVPIDGISSVSVPKLCQGTSRSDAEAVHSLVDVMEHYGDIFAMCSFFDFMFLPRVAVHIS